MGASRWYMPILWHSMYHRDRKNSAKSIRMTLNENPENTGLQPDLPRNQRATEGMRVSVAPMMDWTDRHCRYLHRLLSRHALLYTEMVTTGALMHGDVPRHLRFNAEEHPVALQLGGSEPADLAHCAKLGEEWGYDEINLNCGCPSERVQRGAFGACLMNEPQLVADCVKAMVDVVGIRIAGPFDPDRPESQAVAPRLCPGVTKWTGTFTSSARPCTAKWPSRTTT